MKVEIISPTKTLFSGSVTSATVPSKMGPFTLLQDHAPIVAILEAGKVTLTDEHGERHKFDIKSGFVEQHDNTLIICIES